MICVVSCYLYLESEFMEQFGYAHKVFSNRENLALAVQEVTAKAGYPTALIEIAVMEGRSVNWQDKWQVHIAKAELHAVASVLLGFRNECEFKFHGSNKNVSYKFEKGQGSVVIGIRNAGHLRSIHVPMDSVFWVASIVVSAIVKNAPPGIPESMIIPLLQRTQG